jgi:hypothetical protein
MGICTFSISVGLPMSRPSRPHPPPFHACLLRVHRDDTTLHAAALRSSRNPLRSSRTSTVPAGDLPLTQLEHPLSPGAARVAAALASAAPLPSTRMRAQVAGR